MKLIQKKICLLGDFAVGKTSLVRRFVEGRFDDKYLSTIGVKISRKVLHRKTYQLNLLIWDLAGEKNFDKYRRSYLQGAVGALIVCDLTRFETLQNLSRYTEQLKSVNPGAVALYVGNKLDLEDEHEITKEDLQAVCSPSGETYLLTSAKTSEAVDTAMETLARQIEN